MTEKEREGCWFTEPAKEILDGALRLADRQPCVFEYGMGSSTLYLKDKCRFLASVEHTQEWYDKIKARIGRWERYQKLMLRETPYHEAINEFEDGFFDIVIVDGRNRVKCIQSAIPKIKTGGWLILDNSERDYYRPGIELMKDWNRIDCKQNRPDEYGFTYPDWTTTIFIKP